MLNKTLKSRLPLLLSLIAVLALGKQQVSQADAVVVVATGANAAAIQAKVDEFRNKLGKNNGVGGTFIDGRREVNWDGVPATALDPFPGDFFVVRSARGIEFKTPGTRMKVSGDPDTPSFEFADVTALLPSNNKPWGPIEFSTFSPSKMFATIDSTITEIEFYVPSDPKQHATIKAFGAVFADVDLANTTSMTFYDIANQAIFTYAVPVAAAKSEGLSFVGVVLPENQRAARIKIVAGSHPVNTLFMDPPPDGVGIDDVIFSEPLAIQTVNLPFISKLSGYFAR